MDKAYEAYLEEKWKEAEKMAVKFGCTSTRVLISIFDKICQPYFYWKKGGK